MSEQGRIKVGMYYPVMDEDDDLLIFCCGEDGHSTEMDSQICILTKYGGSDAEDMEWAQSICDKLNACTGMADPAAEIATLRTQLAQQAEQVAGLTKERDSAVAEVGKWSRLVGRINGLLDAAGVPDGAMPTDRRVEGLTKGRDEARADCANWRGMASNLTDTTKDLAESEAALRTSADALAGVLESLMGHLGGRTYINGVSLLATLRQAEQALSAYRSRTGERKAQ